MSTDQKPQQPTPAATADRTTADLVRALTLQGAQPVNVGDHWHAVVPQGTTLQNLSKDVERMRPSPLRARGEVVLDSIASLVDYLSRQHLDCCVLFADPDALTITAVINEHHTTDTGFGPQWRDFRATFKAQPTPEWALWRKLDGEKMDQVAFAEFIEDHIADIVEPSGQQLLDVATTLQAQTGVEFKSARRLDNGQTQFQYVETINATAGLSGSLEIPRQFALGVRLFKNGTPYRIVARLKYRLASGGVRFWYELDRPQRCIEDAFADYIKALATSLPNVPVLMGKPGTAGA